MSEQLYRLTSVVRAKSDFGMAFTRRMQDG